MRLRDPGPGYSWGPFGTEITKMYHCGFYRNTWSGQRRAGAPPRPGGGPGGGAEAPLASWESASDSGETRSEAGLKDGAPFTPVPLRHRSPGHGPAARAPPCCAARTVPGPEGRGATAPGRREGSPPGVGRRPQAGWRGGGAALGCGSPARAAPGG